ncbi:MAG: hypothetical protein K0S51_1988 [Bacillales bacterium]|jgi:protein associated with RNAse G/E|nr:hypothetical protein [Bacillales bacterium]
MSIPNKRHTVQIQSYKHNGLIHRVWESAEVLHGTQDEMIAANDKTIVTEADGRTWITREPAICYFHSNYWFNIIGMIRDDGVYYYCNISSPFVLDEGAIKYIDYDLDIKVFPNYSYILLDEDEYEKHRIEMNYPEVIDQILKQNINILLGWIRDKKGPFAPDFINNWYKSYLE